MGERAAYEREQSDAWLQYAERHAEDAADAADIYRDEYGVVDALEFRDLLRHARMYIEAGRW